MKPFGLALRRNKNTDGGVAGEVCVVKHEQSFEVGTEEWLAQTGGRLTYRQALVLSGQGLAQSARERFNRRQPSPAESFGQVARIAAARDELAAVLATQRARVIERQGHSLVNHACRTFVLGAALLTDDVFARVNLTTAAVAALTHDDGLLHPSTPGNCFTADSAIEADAMMAQLGQSGGPTQVARAAVISHFQPRLPERAGPEARMVALGASADVMGFGLGRLDPGLLEAVWNEWPDLGLLSEVKSLLLRERTRAPRTRPGVLSYSGMPYLLRRGR